MADSAEYLDTELVIRPLAASELSTGDKKPPPVEIVLIGGEWTDEEDEVQSASYGGY